MVAGHPRTAGQGIVRIDEPLNWHRSHAASAIAQENLAHGIDNSTPHRLAPYLHGYRNYRQLQSKPNWQQLYTYIYNASTHCQPLAHRMSGLMLQRGAVPLLKLCLLCARHRKSIYYNQNAKGLMGWIRSFFYPFIFTYHNVQYDL